jgi:uncharacterized surface protein with fasciclin (FAS1) repeats
MKMTFKNYIPLFLLTLLSSCELMTSYEIDTTPNVLIKEKMVDFLKTGKDTIITMYYEAVVHAEMIDELSRDTSETIIIPSNNAFKGLLKEAGYTSITEMNKGALRALLQYMIIPGKYVSYEMLDGSVNQVISRTGDRIYISRNSSSTDGYVLYVNKVPSTDTELSATPLNVSRQDLVFKDKVAQVVDGFPRFLLKIPATDNAPAMGVRLNIEGDTHTWASAAGANVYWSAAVQAGYRTDGSQNRTGMFLFEQKSISQLSEISSATLNFYVIANGTKDPQVSSLKFYDISEQIDWNAYTIKTITKAFKPSITDTTTLIKEATGISMPATWYQLDLTDFIKGYYAKSDRKPLFLGVRPSIKATTGNFTFGWKHEDDPSKSVNPAFIDITGPLETELTVVNNNPINCIKGKNVILTKEMLSMVGPDSSPLNLIYSDQNIIYLIKELPTDGVITKGGLPLGIDGRFTQADIEYKNVKYFNNGNNASDSFKLQGRDYAGGTLKNLITALVNIQ